MSWFMVGTAAVGAVKGTMDANANRKRQKQLDASRKATITYSPWTKMNDPGPISAGNTNAASGFLGGAMQGAMLGNSFKGMASGPAAAPNPANVGMDMSKAQTVSMVDPGMMNKMKGSAGSMGGSWGGLQAQPMDMNPTKDLYGGMLA